jgi:glycosyltransferase involved in cell wall biosynthesis
LSVVICTYNRPDLLRRALRAVEEQTYPGTIETIVVFDKSDPDAALERADGNRPVRTLRNTRTSGLPGARNTGLEQVRAPVAALCDDDDAWGPEKAARQLAFLADHPAVDVVFSGMRAMTDRGPAVRIPDSPSLTFAMLLHDRVPHAHISSAMFRVDALRDRIGLFDEQIPGGYGEDYEWTLRAARAKPMGVVQEPLVDVRWGTGSYFSDKWRTIDEAMQYLVDEFPEFTSDRRGFARVLGQQAFARAAAGDRKDAWPKIRETVRNDWRQPRAYLAALVALRLASPERILRELNRRGRGM